jgi:hypothetical protein
MQSHKIGEKIWSTKNTFSSPVVHHKGHESDEKKSDFKIFNFNLKSADK